MAKKLLRYYVVDAFTESAFKGNPAAVCLLEEERDDEWLQAVATEFNISETCYLTRLAESQSHDSPVANPKFRLRWFTPVAEVDLCGHATLAAAHTLFSRGLVKSNTIEFATRSGLLTAKKINESKLQNVEEQENYFIELDFPVVPVIEFNSSAEEDLLFHKSLNVSSIIDIKRTSSDNIIVVVPSAEAVLEVEPNICEMMKCPGEGIIVSGVASPASGYDFYSRYFCPKFGINEDPVTGSAHCSLAAYWSQKLGKNDFVAYQASPRSGVLKVHLDEENQRVLLQGKAVTVMEGSLLD